MLLVGDDLRLLTATAQADADLRAILPTERDRAPVPAGALNVAAQLLAVEGGVDAHPPSARVHLGGGQWCTFAAARLDDDSGSGAIAVSIERTPPQWRADLYGRAIGLTDREAELLRALLGGGDTRSIADRLFVSPHTVQDHLKSIFAKSGLRSAPPSSPVPRAPPRRWRGPRPGGAEPLSGGGRAAARWRGPPRRTRDRRPSGWRRSR